MLIRFGKFLICCGKGATAWEFQIGTERHSVQFNYVHLNGGYFVRFKPWRRIRFYYWGPDR